jgi:flagellar biosynthesis/type III secretory pathway chaperone
MASQPTELTTEELEVLVKALRDKVAPIENDRANVAQVVLNERQHRPMDRVANSRTLSWLEADKAELVDKLAPLEAELEKRRAEESSTEQIRHDRRSVRLSLALSSVSIAISLAAAAAAWYAALK